MSTRLDGVAAGVAVLGVIATTHGDDLASGREGWTADRYESGPVTSTRLCRNRAWIES